MTVRGLPGTLAPTYQLSFLEKRVMLATAAAWATHSSWAWGLASMVARRLARMWSRQAAIQSTCCSMERVMLLRTLGDSGPVMVNRFGKPATVSPKYVTGPSFQTSRSVLPSLPWTSTPSSAPVMASKPVARTMTSRSTRSMASSSSLRGVAGVVETAAAWSSLRSTSSETGTASSTPVSTKRRMGVRRKLTRRTWSRLKVS
mmetsp:Transcript_18652/g.57337  ORF Transcript_18652/g.57337 Transcript_18652/m.57337 type:complete len:202 (-) Transcript_18652:1054-1659(-)